MRALELVQTFDRRWLDEQLQTHGYEALKFDGACQREEMTVRSQLRDAENVFLKVLQEGRAEGYFRLRPRQPGLVEAHVILGPGCRGAQALQAGRMMLAWAREKLGAWRVAGFCPDWCRNTLLLAAAAGGRIESRHYGAITRGGVAHDLVHFSFYV